jgi:hypothetical protein
MPIIRLLILVVTTGMTAITLLILVSVMLGVAWLAVAVPALVVIGIVAVGRTLWRRFGRPPGASNE